MTEVLNADGTPHESNGRRRSTTQTRISGSASSRNTASGTTRTMRPSAFQRGASPLRRGSTTARSAPQTQSDARSSKNISTSASMPALTSKASTPK
jgi:hypothetical protein